MVYGYIRISTPGQSAGYGMDVQEREILARYPDAIIRREQHTGSGNRPVLQALLEEMDQDSVLAVHRLDRLARNTAEGIQIVEDLFLRSIAVHVLNIGLLENTSMGRFFLTVMLAVAEMEKNTILERTSAGRSIARQADDYRDGRPKKYSKEQLNLAMSLLKTNSYTQVERMTGISRSTLTRENRLRKI